MSDTDLELLARYTRHHAEEAFAELVRRHVSLVYSAALRQVRSPQVAEEVAQSVFIDLACQAARLKHATLLTAWLYQVTRRTAIDVVRREASRQLREQISAEMNAINATAPDWMQIEPLLDEAMSRLDDTDRTAVLLRYFENKSLREVGQTLGTSDDAAQKRVSRAVERLRQILVERGVSIGAGGLVLVISANAVQAAPTGLAVAISAAAASSVVAAHFTSTLVAMKLLKVKIAVVLAATSLAGGAAYFLSVQRAPFRQNEPVGTVPPALTTNEILYAEMLDAAPIAFEVVPGHPTQVFWEERKDALMKAGYIETRDIPLPKALSARGASRTFFDRFQKRFYGVQMGVRGLNNGDTPPIAYVTARKTDFGPDGAIEQFIRRYDPDRQRPKK